MNKLKNIVSVVLLIVSFVIASEVQSATSRADSSVSVSKSTVVYKNRKGLSKSARIVSPGKTNWSKIKDLFM